MSKVHYYMTVFPTEALIASMLSPEQFGSYMATSSKRGSHERLMFAEIEQEFGPAFDWEYGKSRCVPHKNGEAKHSVYLSVYRVLEQVPPDALGDLFLTTSDGRTLALQKTAIPPDVPGKPFHLYQELCPVQPLVVSSLAPKAFGEFLISGKEKISLPALFYCDLKVIDFNHLENSGNVGPMYDHNLGHLSECIKAVTERGKTTKTLDRTFANDFRFQIVKDGFCFMSKLGSAYYPMPSESELNTRYYDWARSAMIL